MTLAEDFKRLRDEWDGGTAYTSSSTVIASHPALLAIIALGRPVVPHIIADWELSEPEQYRHWFSALEAITGVKAEDIIGEESAGSVNAMVDRWMHWWYHRSCTWEERVETAIAAGGRCYTPNGLPIKCLPAHGLLHEGEHGDHMDYKFPIKVEYVGPAQPDPYHIEFVDNTHAVIYSDGCIILTMYECCYCLWALRDGHFVGGFGYNRHWRVKEESLVKVREAGIFMRETSTMFNNMVDQMIEDRRSFKALKKAAEIAYHVWNSPSDSYEQRGAMLQLGQALKEVEELPPVPESLRHPHAKTKKV